MIDMVGMAMDRLRRGLTCETMGFKEFIPAAWPIIEPGTALMDNWHIGAIAEHLEAVTIGQIQFLIINIPPRNLKSNLCSKLWPCWSWTQRPTHRWIFISYSQILAETFSKDRRDLITSEWYQQRWGPLVRIADDQNQKREFMNTARGSMVATSIGGTLTGKGADIIVIDDGINPEQAASKAERENAIRYVKGTVSTRLNDKRTGAIVEISQRTDKNDISGTLLQEGIYTHLNLPAIAERKTIITLPISKKEIIREPGHILNPAREDAAILERQKKQMTINGKSLKTFQAQYQQNPASDEGAMFPRSCWKFHTMHPLPIWKIWSWDTAMEEGEENDWTVGAYLVFHGTGVCIERVVRARMQYPELKRAVLSECETFAANQIVIENKVSGISLAQDLKRNTSLPVIAYPRKGDLGKRDVRGDKIFRASLASPYMESGRVSLKEGSIWIPELIEEFAGFPEGDHDDQVDAVCQGINAFYQSKQMPASMLVGGAVHVPEHKDKPSGGQHGRPSWA